MGPSTTWAFCSVGMSKWTILAQLTALVMIVALLVSRWRAGRAVWVAGAYLQWWVCSSLESDLAVARNMGNFAGGIMVDDHVSERRGRCRFPQHGIA